MAMVGALGALGGGAAGSTAGSSAPFAAGGGSGGPAATTKRTEKCSAQVLKKSHLNPLVRMVDALVLQECVR